MTPEETINFLMNRVNELQRDIEELKRLSLQPSLKVSSSESKSVNEGASAQYTVALPPDGFRQVVDRGELIHIPFYYTA